MDTLQCWGPGGSSTTRRVTCKSFKFQAEFELNPLLRCLCFLFDASLSFVPPPSERAISFTIQQVPPSDPNRNGNDAPTLPGGDTPSSSEGESLGIVGRRSLFAKGCVRTRRK